MVFVDRRAELERISHLARAATNGKPERHLAFTGVRRIGKSRLVDHYRENDPPIAVARINMDSAASTAPTFLRSMIRETINAIARRRRLPMLDRAASDLSVAAAAAGISSELAALAAQSMAPASARRIDVQGLLEIGLTFPEAASELVDEPILVIADEFQHIVDLAIYPPFESGRRRTRDAARASLLGVVRSAIERPNHVGWVITGSGVRLLQHLLGTGPLMGRFDVFQVLPLDEGDCLELADAIWNEAAVDALDSARQRVYRLTQGHPFYADISCREAANVARRLGNPVSAAMVDSAFVGAILRPSGQIAIACKEMYDSFTRHAPGLRGFLDALSVGEPATLNEIGERMGIGLVKSLYRFADDLGWMGLVEPQEGGGFAFADPVFRYWVARANDPSSLPPSPFDPGAWHRNARLYEEAYLREREIHGTLTEGFIRDLCRSFSGQRIDGKRFGCPGEQVRLPAGGRVSSVFAHDEEGIVHGRPADVELDLCFGSEVVWLGEVKRTSGRAGTDDIALLERKALFLRRRLKLAPGPIWFVSLGGFRGAARDAARQHGIYTSTMQDLKAISAIVGTRR